MPYYGDRYFNDPAGFIYGESLVQAPLTAVCNEYGRVYLTWGDPAISWSKYRILRSTYGTPESAFSGSVVVEITNGVAHNTTLVDVVSPGTTAYYALYSCSATGVWRILGEASVIVAEEGTGLTSLANAVPRMYVSADGDVTGQIEDDNPLVQWLAGLGFWVDRFKTEARLTMAESSRLHPNLVAPRTGGLGGPVEPGLGSASQRRMMQSLSLTQAKRGTVSSISSMASALTGWNCGVVGPSNIVPSIMDACYSNQARIRDTGSADSTLGLRTVLPTPRSVSKVQLTSNVATITTSTPHDLKPGHTVTLASVSVSGAVFNGTYTVVATPSDTTFTYARTNANIAWTDATGTVSASEVASSTTVASVQAWAGEDTSFPNNLKTVRVLQCQTANSGVAYIASDFDPTSSTTRLQTRSNLTRVTPGAHYSAAFAVRRVSPASGSPSLANTLVRMIGVWYDQAGVQIDSTKTVSNVALTSNVATITTSAAHGMSVGDTAVVSGVSVSGAVFNGTYTVASVPSATTFTYARTNANIGSTAATGSVQPNVTLVAPVTPAAAEAWTYAGMSPTTAVTAPTGAVYLAWKIHALGDNLETLHLGGVRIAPVKRRNLAPYTNAETGATTGWTTGAVNCSLAVATVVGTQAYRMTATAGGDMSIRNLASLVPARAGEVYSASVRFRPGSTARTVRLDAVFLDAAQAVLSTTTGWVATTDATNRWTTAEVTATAPASTAYIVHVANVIGAAASEIHYVDCLLVEQGAALGNYFDGTTVGCSWSGTTNASSSLITPVPYRDPRLVNIVAFPARSNWSVNPSAETDAVGWGTNVNCTVSRSTAQARNGTASLLMTSSAAGVMGMITNTTSSAVPVVVGKNYTLSVYAYTATASRTVTLGIVWYNQVGFAVGLENSVATALPTSAWTRYSLTAAAPATAAYAMLAVTISTPSGAGETVYVDSVLFEESPVLGDYFDGSLDPSATNEVVWEGGTAPAASHLYPGLLAKKNRLAALLPEYVPATTPWRLVLANQSDWRTLRNSYMGDFDVP